MNLEVKFSGILKAVGPELSGPAVHAIPELGGRPLAAKNWHVTLVHQSLLKPHRKFLKSSLSAFLSEVDPFPSIEFDPVTSESHRQSVDPGSRELRESWVLWVTPETQAALEIWVENFLTKLGAEGRENRRFHLTVSNLTGNPSDSVR